MQISKCAVESLIRQKVGIEKMQFGFIAVCGNSDVTFILYRRRNTICRRRTSHCILPFWTTGFQVISTGGQYCSGIKDQLRPELRCN